VQRRRSKVRSLGIGILLLSLSCVVSTAALELGAEYVYSTYRHKPFERGEVQARLLIDRMQKSPLERLAPALAKQIEKYKNAAVPDPPVVVHPYFGYIANPDSPAVNEYGFFYDPPLVKPDPDTFTVAIFGGSLADQVFYMATDTLIRRLQERHVADGKKIHVVSTALGGYKQPQQLNVLSYMLARGAAYDVVVNLDGYNEIDGAFENVIHGVHPDFPHNWNLHGRRGLDPQTMTHLGRIDLIRERRRQLRELFGREPFVHSAFFLTLWDLLDFRQEARQRAEVATLKTMLSGDLSPRITGPSYPHGDDQRLLHDVADLWQRSSRQMKAECDVYGVKYVHFLQPNQYFPGSKELTEEEQENAYLEDDPAVDRIPAGYPLLRQRGRQLRTQGVRFIDLTMIFADEHRTVYSDPCCHVNQLGANLLAERIADSLAGTS
jgi:hypothetical protein